jgi:hypothetical protein
MNVSRYHISEVYPTHLHLIEKLSLSNLFHYSLMHENLCSLVALARIRYVGVELEVTGKDGASWR